MSVKSLNLHSLESDSEDERSQCQEHRSRTSLGSSTLSFGSSAVFSWGKIAKKQNFWDHVSDDVDEERLDVGLPVRNVATTCSIAIQRTIATALRIPSIWITTLLTFAALLGAGLATIDTLAEAHSSALRKDAIVTAEELGMWISSKLDDALSPLFAMSQFVQHLEEFKALPFEIGARGEPGAAPPLTGEEITHRNVTGICDDPPVVTVFNEIASNIKKDAGMEGILVNIQLAPKSVVCLLYPVVNTEDFEDGVVMNNTEAIGHDLLNDPNRTAIARATVPADGVVIAGPLPLIQGDTPVVKEAFIARLPINMPGYDIKVDGEDYPCWGFAVILLNWAALKDKAGIDQRFRRVGLEYRLTRADVKIDATTGAEYEEIATIAESSRSAVLDEDNSVAVDLDTTNNVWKMTVGYEGGFKAPWVEGLIALVVLLSTFISVLIMTVLVANLERKTLLYKMMPPKVVKKLQKGKTVVQKYDISTVFFSDVVGFTKLSADLSALDVMDMLNDMYTQFDALVAKHKLYKVDTIGDAYIVIGGGPDGCLGRTGAESVAQFALDAIEACKNIRAKNGAQVSIRAGLASGPVVAGVVGKSMPKFTLFGDTVNFASRMESTSIKMKIQCSEMTYRLLTDANDSVFNLEKRVNEDGEEGVFAKGKGRVPTWWIHGSKPRCPIPSTPNVLPAPHALDKLPTSIRWENEKCGSEDTTTFDTAPTFESMYVTAIPISREWKGEKPDIAKAEDGNVDDKIFEV